MKTSHRRQNDGFTTIEVLMVLAIAGIMLLIILLAVPNVKRDERNIRRKNGVNYVLAMMNQYYNDNDGLYPLGGTAPAQDNRAAFVTELKTSGPSKLFDIRYVDNEAAHEHPYSGSDAPANLGEALDEISIMPGHVCNRASNLMPGDVDYPLKSDRLGDTNFKAFAVWTLLEVSNHKVYCVDSDS